MTQPGVPRESGAGHFVPPKPDTDIPLSNSGKSRLSRLAESLLLPAIPAVIVFLASWISSPRHWFNPVDLSLAMLSIAAVIAVQLMEDSKDTPKAEMVFPVVLLICAVAVFVVFAAVGAYQEAQSGDSLDATASAAVTVLQSADSYVESHPTTGSESAYYNLQFNIQNSEKALTSIDGPGGDDSPGLLAASLVATAIFLGLTFVLVWRKS
jgi:hypothetical protein